MKIKLSVWGASVLSFLSLVACGAAPDGGDAAGGDGGDGAGSELATSGAGAGDATSGDTTSGGDATSGSTTSGGSTGQGGGADDPYGPDPDAVLALDGGDIEGCLPELLSGGVAGAYAGFAGTSDGAYLIWKNAWSGSSLNLRIETWDAFGGITAPGTYEVTAADESYDTCGVCVFSETAEDGEFWLMRGSTITFTSLATGEGGVGKPLAGTLSGTMSNGFCTGTVEVSFHAVAKDVSYGPL
jgi:hypothetical protein